MDLKNMESKIIVQQWDALFAVMENSMKRIDACSQSSPEKEQYYQGLIQDTNNLLEFVHALQKLNPDEFVELSDAHNIFKKATQEDLIRSLSNGMSSAYNNLGNCLLDIHEPNFNPAVHSYLTSLLWAHGNEYALDNVWYCLDLAAKFMKARQITLPHGSTNEGWVRCHNSGYDILKSPNQNPARAIEAYQKALAINPKFPATLHGLGIAYSFADMKDEAIRAWIETKKLEKDFNFEVRVVIAVK
jgi:tetratricopeptide (TPR) repeat protein